VSSVNEVNGENLQVPRNQDPGYANALKLVQCLQLFAEVSRPSITTSCYFRYACLATGLWTSRI